MKMMPATSGNCSCGCATHGLQAVIEWSLALSLSSFEMKTFARPCSRGRAASLRVVSGKSSFPLRGPGCGPSFTPNTRLFSYRLRCFHVAQYEMSIVVRWSRYQQYSLVRPILVWDTRYMASLIHRSSTKSSLCFLVPISASFAFQWSFCHRPSQCFCASCVINPHEKIRNGHNFKLRLNSLFLFWRRSKAHTTGAVDQSFRCVFEARLTLNRLGYLTQTHTIRYFPILEVYDSINR